MKNYFKILTIASALAMMSFACNEKSSPLMSKKIESDNLIDITTQIKSDNIMSREDISFFMTGISEMPIDKLTGKTVGEVIEEKKAASANVLKNNLVIKANQRMLANSIAYGLPKQNAMQNLTKDGIIVQHRLTVNFKNQTKKDCESFTGSFVIKFNNDGKSYQTKPIRVTYPALKAGETKAFAQNFKASDKSMLTAAMLSKGDKEVTFSSEKIVFEDGSMYSILTEAKK